jgi:hypothetical protein
MCGGRWLLTATAIPFASTENPIMKKRRDTEMTWCEVVRVDSPLFLVSSRQNACHYETRDSEPLALGHYLVLWPTGANRSFYGRECRYLGPFATNAIARLAQTSALGLGIVNLEVHGNQPASRRHAHAASPALPAYSPLLSMAHSAVSPMHTTPGSERISQGA